MEYILLNNLENKHSLFMSYYKIKKFIKKYNRNCYLRISFKPFYACEE